MLAPTELNFFWLLQKDAQIRIIQFGKNQILETSFLSMKKLKNKSLESRSAKKWQNKKKYVLAPEGAIFFLFTTK